MRLLCWWYSIVQIWIYYFMTYNIMFKWFKTKLIVIWPRQLYRYF
jgi:hypothetical protein